MTEPSDVVSFRNDKKQSGMPRELHRRRSGAPPKPPALWTSPPTLQPESVLGQYPKNFIPWAARLLRVATHEILHLCSGSLPAGHGRVRVDIRRAAAPDVQADARRLPFADGTFAAVMIDPPYSVEYADELYGVEYPRPSHLLAEASRVVRPCGRVGILHFMVPMPPPGCRLELVRGVTTGCGYRIRAFTVFEREQDGLFPVAMTAPATPTKGAA